MEKKEEKKVCCICGKEYEGYGYNPFPVKEEGCCCQSCNYSVVVPERWERHKAFQRGEVTGAGKVYISGAIAHYDMNERKEAFSRAEEKLTGQDEWRQKLREELRRKRSVCLKLMQQLGIDTTDWNRVNEFCNNPRIAGKPFVQISTAELEQLAIKLRAIQRKGGLTDK